MRRLDLSVPAEKQLRKLPEKHRAAVAERLLALRREPYPEASRQLEGHLYRCVDAGTFRLLYAVGAERVTVAHIVRRTAPEVYALVPRRR